MDSTTYQVLLVEERETDAELIGEALLQCSLPCVVTHVRRLSDALEQTVSTAFDIVLLDLFLDDSRGLDTFVAMRSYAPRLPMVLLTDSTVIEITSEAAKKGAQDILNKDEISPAVLAKTMLYAIERKRHELELHRQKEFYENLLQEANVWVEALDRNGNVILWNRGAEQISGYPAREMMHSQRRWEALYSDAVLRERLLEDYRMSLREERSVENTETEIRIASGQARIISWNSNIIRGADGRTAGIMFVGNDVTERRASEREITRSEDRFRILADLTSDYVYSASFDGDFTITTEWVEGAFQQITGYAPEEVIGNTGAWEKLIHPDDRSNMARMQNEMGEQHPLAFEYRILLRDGSVRWLRDHIFPIIADDNRVKGMHGAVRDITEQRETEISLMKEEEKLRGIIENAADGIALMNEQGHIIEWSPAMEQITGIPRAEAIGSMHWDIQHRLALPEDHAVRDVRAESRRQIEEYLSHGKSPWLNRLFDRWIQRPDGEQRYIEMVSFPVRSSQGLLTGSVTRDITEVKLAELDLEKKNRQLEERNQELDTFTQSVAHDLKNPLSLILGYAEMVQSESGALTTDELREYMGSVLFNGRKMISIINALLLLASVRKEEVQLEQLDMQQIVEDAMRRLHRLIDEQHATVTLPDSWPSVRGYSAWIEEVWVNYIGNAVKHGGRGVHVAVGIEEDGEMIRFLVRDDGPGIPPDRIEDLFAPFVRLSQAKIEGHGLGLSIVRRIIEKIGGEVGVSSEPGRETVFFFTLPKAP